jgi:hypothetical protein
MDDDDDTLRGMAQTTVPHTDRILKAMDRHILNGDMLKARRSTKGPGVANIGEVSIQSKPRSLYPSRPDDRPVPDLLETRRQSVDHLTICIEDTDSLARHIMEQKRGASAGITGHSNDHYQDILRAHPEAITSIMSLCNLIAIGSLPDGPARKLLLSGKGTALHKSPTGIRPIVTLVPCGQYTSHAIATEYKAQIQEICGDKQFMGVSYGFSSSPPSARDGPVQGDD